MTDYTGMSYEDAVKDLMENYNLRVKQIVKKEVASNSAEPGQIISQTPEAGDRFDPSGDGEVVFEVATASSVTMPALVGYSYADAKNALLELGFKSSQIQADSDQASSSAIVYAQYPYAGTVIELAANDRITLYLSTTSDSSSTTSSEPASSSDSTDSTASSSSSSTSDSEHSGSEIPDSTGTSTEATSGS